VKLEVEFGKVDEDLMGDLLLRKAQEAGLLVVPPERREPFTVAEVAAALSVSVDTIYGQIKAGRLPILPRMGVKLVPAWAVRIRQEGGDPMRELERRKMEEEEGFR
jgi:excisionase family DNA binding protein